MLEQKLIKLGEVSGVFGVKGWVKLYSFTEPRENILKYSPWLLKKGLEVKCIELSDGAVQGKTIVAKLHGIQDRDQAFALIGSEVWITPEQLPKAAQGEYYWSDLIGLTVETVSGFRLGVIDHLLETGANDVVIVKGEKERAIPFLPEQVIITVDLTAGVMIVDWDPDF